ncbi:MAG: hypothetical protein CME71_01800 [Halobacteriovorax sp.]|nr:hypothetical protein [Halobacteriovorax sp.]
MSLVIGLITGFLMCIPIGPINVWVINTRIKKNAATALAIALGGSLMDLAYFYTILSGLSFFEFTQTSGFYFKLIGILVILVMGVKELMAKGDIEIAQGEKVTNKGLMAGFMTGVLIYTSNPTLILTMTGLGAFIKSLEIFEFNQLNIVLCALGLSIGSFLWFVLLVKVVDRYQEKIREKYLELFSRTSGILMVALSMYMGYKLATL